MVDVLGILSAIGLYLWDSFKLWLHTIFVAPFNNFEMLWILIPIYIGWVLADFFQEKKGTSIGNAISNAIVVFWAGIDWIRTSIRTLSTSEEIHWGYAVGKFTLALLVVLYGVLIVWEGVKGRALTKYIGRIREVTYVTIMFTPVYYDATELTWQLIFSVIIFFPAFYYIVEWIDYIVPDPESIKEDRGASAGSGSSLDFGKSDFGKAVPSKPGTSSLDFDKKLSSGMNDFKANDFKI